MGLILTIVLLGFLVWALITYVPMPPPFRGLVILVAIFMVVFMIFGSGALDSPNLRFPRF